MKKWIMVFAALLYILPGIDLLFAAANTWTQKADFGGTARNYAVAFSIGGSGYLGMGWDSSYRKDFWKYDPFTDTWTQKADFGGTARKEAVGFSIGSKGYIGTGHDETEKLVNDFWEYDSTTNAWTQKADFGAFSVRRNAVGFSIGDKGYIGTGKEGEVFKNDFWEYDPVTNIWTQKADFGGAAREYAVGFSIGNRGYIGTGRDGSSLKQDFWEYNPATNIWLQRAGFGGTARSGAVGFTIGGKGYVGTGNDGINRNDFWEYDPASETWTRKADFGGTERNLAAAFSVGSSGFIATGYDNLSRTKDLWEYSPFTFLYFPHIATSVPWQTEIAIINTGNQTVTGTLKGMSDEGQLVETRNVVLSAHGRRQMIIAQEFAGHADIGYIIFESDSDTVRGYTKFFINGTYRTAIPAVRDANSTDIYVSHIASTTDWWTGISLVNTTSETKVLTMTFNTGLSVSLTLQANQHQVFDIAQAFFNNQPQLGIQSAVISNANGVIGLELFGSLGWGTQLEGILLTDSTSSTLYYPHVAGNEWWTGIVAYNTSPSAGTITIYPFTAEGTSLSTSTRSIAGKAKYVGAVSDLNLPAGTAWFRIDSSKALSGFELFGTANGNRLAAYAGGGGGAKEGVFAKVEKSGWTGIAFVNTESGAASVTLTAYDDDGMAVATRVLAVGGHAKVVDAPEEIFTQDIGNATWIAYASDKRVVGFQLNGSADGKMLDGLPGM